MIFGKFGLTIAVLATNAPYRLFTLSADTEALDPLLRESSHRRLGRNIRSYDQSAGGSIGEFMQKANLKTMTTQTMAADGSLFIDNEILFFANANLEMDRVMSDGSDANIYNLLDGGREISTAADSTIKVLKRNDVVKKLSKTSKVSGERISAALMDDGKTYAVFAVEDIDFGRLGGLNVDTLLPPSTRRLHEDRRAGNKVQVQRTLVDENGCSGYQVLRMNVMFDSQFCVTAGGTEQDAIDAITTIIADMNVFYETSPGLCMKVQLCGVSGSCTPSTDKFRPLIDTSMEFCDYDDPMSLIFQFQNYVYTKGLVRRGDIHNARYPNGECDTTHLFFGGGNNPLANLNVVGCAFITSLCTSFALGVVNVGRYTNNPIIQTTLVAHELSHNAGSFHDTVGGYIMQPTVCSTCTQFSPNSVIAMTNYVDSRDDNKCIGTECSVFTNPGQCNQFPGYSCAWVAGKCVPSN